MATYQELRGLFGHNELKNKVEVACIVAAEGIRSDPSPPANQAARLVWAVAAFNNPKAAGAQMLMALLAGNKDLEVAAITSPDDAAIQAKVDAAVDLFADGS